MASIGLAAPMSLAPGTQRVLLLTAGVMFGAFLIVAFVFRRLDVSQETLSVVGGLLAYAFLAAAAAILWRGYRHRGRRVIPVIERFLAGHPAVIARVGEPVEVTVLHDPSDWARGQAQANARVEVHGPDGDATADLVMARLGADWEVLSGTLAGAGAPVPLGGAAPD